MDFNQIKVKDRASFIAFISLFRKDLELNKDKWENVQLGNFLEAMERYSADIGGFYNNTRQFEENADKASWKRFADILQGARIYE
jgi:hypothetical protein